MLLNSKEAIRTYRNGESIAWIFEYQGKYLVVEYIPENYPSLYVFTESLSGMKEVLKAYRDWEKLDYRT